MKHNTSENKITEGVIWKQLLIFFLPLLLGTFFQQLYNTVDAVIVGRFVGKEALAAVGGAAAMIVNLFVGFFTGVSTGATVTISQFYGGGGKKQVREAIHTALAVAATAGAAIMVMGLIWAPTALKWMNTPPETMADSVVYIRIYFCGMIGNLVYNMGAGILRAMGDSKRPLYFLIASCLVNIVLDIFFVIVLGLGVTGVALATILSQLFSAALVCLVLSRLEEEIRLHLKEIRFHGWVVKRILSIGLPAGAQTLTYSLSNMIVQADVNYFGTSTVAAWTAYSKVDAVFWMVVSSFGVAVTTFVGQNYGAGLYGRVRTGVRQCLCMTVVTSFAITGALLPGGKYLLGLFTKDQEVLAIGMGMIRFLAPFYITYVCVEIFSGALRGMGDALIPMLLSFGGICLLRSGWLLIAVPTWNNMKTVMFSYPLTWIVTSILFIIYYSIYVRRRRIV